MVTCRDMRCKESRKTQVRMIKEKNIQGKGSDVGDEFGVFQELEGGQGSWSKEVWREK